MSEKEIAAKVLELRRDLEPHKFFIPNDSQMPCMSSSVPERWSMCGNGSGKTASLVLQGVWHLTGDYPDWFPEKMKCKLPSNGAFSTTTFTNATEKGLIYEFQKWCPGGLGRTKTRRFRWDTRMKRISDKKTGSVIDFFSYDQDPKDWAGPTKDYWLWDEHGSHDHYQEAKRALRGSPATFCAGLTPVQGISWELDLVVEQEDGVRLQVFRGRTIDNKANLPEDYLETLTRGLTEDQKRIRLFGDFIELSGLVYPEFDIIVHSCDEFDVNKDEYTTWPKILIIDPGYRNPCARLWCAVSPDRQLYFYREYYVEKRTAPENAEALVEMTPEDEGIVYVLIDPAGHDMTTHKTVTELYEDTFHNLGHNWPVYPAEKDKTAGISNVRARLQDRTIHFFPGLVHTFKEFRRYVHQSQRYRSLLERNKKEKPKEYYDHLMDCCRYAIMDDPNYWDVTQKETNKSSVVQFNARTGY